ncbi:hypothetical protein V1282_006901 [Nitrobacteraceae bacterium AZCC 2146]
MFRAIPIKDRGTLTSFWGLFWMLVCLHQLYYGWFMVRSSFVPYVMDGNETFSVWWHSHNLYTFSFWKSFGLTDESYGLTEASHPFFHTHQGNMPRLFGFLIYALGARTVEAQVLVTTLIIGNLTLFFCYASIAKVTRPAIAFIFCLFLFSDYLLYAQWHVVTYRVWYGFLFFGTLFAISSASPENRIWPYALLGVLFFLVFYFELVFAGYVSIAAGLYVLWLHWGSPKRIARLYAVQAIAGLASLAMLFSQLVLVFGLDVVKADFATTFLARNASTLGMTDSVELFFRNHNIVFWNNFRDGGSLRMPLAFARSIGNYIFQVWTPAFSILVIVPFAGVLISFLQRNSVPSVAADGSTARGPNTGSSSHLFEARIVGPRRARSLSWQIPAALTRGGIWPLLAYAVVAILALKVVVVSGALFGLAPASAPRRLWTIVLGIAIVGSLVLLVFTGWTNRPFWMAVCRGILAIAFGALFVAKSYLLFDQTYSEIWLPLVESWKVRLVLRAATIIAFVASAGIAAFGATASFGHEGKLFVRRALAFLAIGIVCYTSIYMLSPGYVISGYAERYAPFAIFFVAMVPAIAIYAMSVAARRYGQWLLADSRFQHRRRVVVPLLVAIVIAAPALLWVRVQVYYANLFPPDHLAFLQKLKSPPLHGATFAVSNYAAPVAYYAGNWAYFDTVIGSAAADVTDPSSRWFADWKSNARYAYPNYYVCMRTKTFDSVLLERYPARLELPFRFCNDERIFRKKTSLPGEVIASDFAEPKFWSAVALDAASLKIDAVLTSVSFLDDHWTIVPGLKIEPNLAHPTTSSEFRLLALPEAASCDIKESDLKAIQANRDNSNFELPRDFKGVFLVRARAGADIGVSKWKSGGLWIVKATTADSAGIPSRCPITIAGGSFGVGGLPMHERGWGDAEPWGTWTTAPEATLRPFLIPDIAVNSDLLFEATVRAFVPKPGGVQQITVRANGVAVASWILSDTKPEQEVSARIPNSAMTGRPTLVLSFNISNPASPASAGLSPDTRELGMGLIEFRLKKWDQ